GEQVTGLQNVHASDVDLGPDEIVLGVQNPLSLGGLDNKFGIQCDQGWCGVRRIDCYAALGTKNRVLAVPPHGSVSVANISSGTVAGPTRAVIPATSVLINVTAERALIADLGRRPQPRGLRQQAILLF